MATVRPSRYFIAFCFSPSILTVGRDAIGAGCGVLILQGILQAAQAFQHIAVGIGQCLTVLPAAQSPRFALHTGRATPTSR